MKENTSMAQFAAHSPTNNEDYNRQILKLLADPSQDAKSIFKLLKLPTAPDFPASPNWNEKLFSEMELKTAPRITKDDRRISGSDISATVVTPTAQIGPPQNIVHVHVYNSQPDDSKSKGKVDNKLLAVQGRDWKLHADDEIYGSSSDSEGCVGYASNQKNVITSVQRGAPAPKGGGMPNVGGPVTCFSTFSPKQKTLEPMGFRTAPTASIFDRQPEVQKAEDSRVSTQSKPSAPPIRRERGHHPFDNSEVSVSIDTVSQFPEESSAESLPDRDSEQGFTPWSSPFTSPQVPPKDVVQAEKKRVQRSAAPALRSASPAARENAVQAEKERVPRSVEPAQRSISPVPRVLRSTAQPNKPPTPRSPTPKCLQTEDTPDASDLENWQKALSAKLKDIGVPANDVLKTLIPLVQKRVDYEVQLRTQELSQSKKITRHDATVHNALSNLDASECASCFRSASRIQMLEKDLAEMAKRSKTLEEDLVQMGKNFVRERRFNRQRRFDRLIVRSSCHVLRWFFESWVYLSCWRSEIEDSLSRKETAATPPQAPRMVQAEQKRVQRAAAPAPRSTSPVPNSTSPAPSVPEQFQRILHNAMQDARSTLKPAPLQQAMTPPNPERGLQKLFSTSPAPQERARDTRFLKPAPLQQATTPPKPCKPPSHAPQEVEDEIPIIGWGRSSASEKQSQSKVQRPANAGAAIQRSADLEPANLQIMNNNFGTVTTLGPQHHEGMESPVVSSNVWFSTQKDEQLQLQALQLLQQEEHKKMMQQQQQGSKGIVMNLDAAPTAPKSPRCADVAAASGVTEQFAERCMRRREQQQKSHSKMQRSTNSGAAIQRSAHLEPAKHLKDAPIYVLDPVPLISMDEWEEDEYKGHQQAKQERVQRSAAPSHDTPARSPSSPQVLHSLSPIFPINASSTMRSTISVSDTRRSGSSWV